MRSLIASSLDIICQIGIVLILLAALIAGWQVNGIMGAIMYLIGAFIFSVIMFGALFVLLDIRDNTRRMADAAERNG